MPCDLCTLSSAFCWRVAASRLGFQCILLDVVQWLTWFWFTLPSACYRVWVWVATLWVWLTLRDTPFWVWVVTQVPRLCTAWCLLLPSLPVLDLCREMAALTSDLFFIYFMSSCVVWLFYMLPWFYLTIVCVPWGPLANLCSGGFLKFLASDSFLSSSPILLLLSS